MEALISMLFPFLFSGKKMTINLVLRFKNAKKKKVVLPVYAFEKGSFKILLPVYRNKELEDIICINLPIQVVVNPSKELYRFLRMRGVI